MKTFEEIGLHLLKCQNKQTEDCIKEPQYAANEIIFSILKRPASYNAIERVRDRLTEYGKQIANAECRDKAKAKKDELLTQLRDMVRKLIKAAQDIHSLNDNTNEMKVFNYQVSKYLRLKENNCLEDTEILKLLKENKEINEDYKNPSYKFLTMQQELITILNEKYKLN